MLNSQKNIRCSSVILSVYESENLMFYVGDLANAVRRRTDLHFGLYHSLFEWFNPIYNADSESNFTTRRFVEVCRH